MKKIALEEIESALREANIAQPQQNQVLEYLKQVAAENAADTSTPKSKNEFGVVLFDKDNLLSGKDFTACIYQVKEGDDHNTVLARLSESARTQNEAAKRKKNIIKTMGELFNFLKPKFVKEKGIKIKTKEPVRVLISNNNLL